MKEQTKKFQYVKNYDNMLEIHNDINF